ncbi:hypothetical protein [Kordia jejudonensis]|uniref:hypothetical protein n=1 Tax=Kordia jejudonensis TaxID=1348245 RepID=UPI0006293973|nr:hypothetical protein [Kordia jejudonensis]
MNKTIYSLVILLFAGSFGLQAQSQKKYQKTFSVTKNTILRFDTQNIDVTFKTWNKDEVKVDFTVNFKNYSEEEIKAISNGIIVAATMQNTMGESSYLQIQNSSPTTIGKLSYRVLKGEIRIENLFFNKEKEARYKTVADINEEIEAGSKGFYDLDGYVVFEDEKVPLKDIDTSSRKEIQSIRSSYEIYIPSYMMVELQASRAKVFLDGTFENVIVGSFQESDLRATELRNEKNSISCVDGSVKINKIIGGGYMFRNVTKSLIGEMEDVRLQTEFSKITIGKITKNVAVSDFKSDFFIYNVGDAFESIQMNCEYSDIKMYVDKTQKYFMEAVGNNAVLNDDGTKIIMQPNRDGEKFKMFTRGKDDAETRKNLFRIDLIHGFVTLLYNK